MWWAKAGDWSAKAVDQYLGYRAAKEANETNVKLARENRAWLEQMSNTEVQRHVKDLASAGLNPMLGYTGQASTPHVAPARVEPTYRSGSESANPRVMESLLMAAQVKGMEASARLTNAQASLEESKIPFSGKMAETAYDIAFKQAEYLSSQIAGKRIENMSMDELRPLLVKAQELKNQAEALGLSEKEAVAKFFEDSGSASKWLQLLKILTDLR